MSGRLIILPKKSYAPWKPENVERVLRDERLERERVEREAEKERKATAEARVALLRKCARGEEVGGAGEFGDGSGGRCSPVPAPRHFNLFEKEEREMAEHAASGGQTQQSAKHGGSDQAKNGGGVMPVYLGGDEAARRKEGSVPFYLRPSGAKGPPDLDTADIKAGEQNEANRRKDEILKTRMDPMQAFVKNDTIRSSRHQIMKAPSVATCTTIHRDGITSTEFEGPEKSEGRQGGTHRRKRRQRDYSSSSDDSSSFSESDDGSSDDSQCSSTDSSTDKRRRRKHNRHDRRSRDRRRSHRDRKKKSRSRSRSKRRYHKGRKRRRESEKNTLEKERSTKGRKQIATLSDAGQSLDEMRRRRDLREKQEAARTVMVRLEEQSCPGSSFRTNDRDRKYQDQYNPSLSRR